MTWWRTRWEIKPIEAGKWQTLEMETALQDGWEPFSATSGFIWLRRLKDEKIPKEER